MTSRRHHRGPLLPPPRASRSSAELLQPGADERVDLRGLAEALGRLRHRAERIAARVAEIDQRRDRIGRGGALRHGDRRRRRPERDAADLVLELAGDARRQLRPDAVGAGERRLVLRQDGSGERIGRQHAQDRQSDPRADALHRGQQPERAALRLVGEAIEMDVILAHMRFDEEPQRLAARGRAAQGARRREDEIADAVDVEHETFRPALLDDAREHGDHRAAPAAQARCVAAWWAWQMATARASAASPASIAAPGSRRRTIISICCLSAWPTPTTDFLIRFAEYSKTGMPRSAGTSSTTPRATPSFKVEAGFLLTKVSSTAASSGRKRSSTSMSWRNSAT